LMLHLLGSKRSWAAPRFFASPRDRRPSQFRSRRFHSSSSGSTPVSGVSLHRPAPARTAAVVVLPAFSCFFLDLLACPYEIACAGGSRWREVSDTANLRATLSIPILRASFSTPSPTKPESASKIRLRTWRSCRGSRCSFPGRLSENAHGVIGRATRTDRPTGKTLRRIPLDHQTQHNRRVIDPARSAVGFSPSSDRSSPSILPTTKRARVALRSQFIPDGGEQEFRVGGLADGVCSSMTIREGRNDYRLFQTTRPVSRQAARLADWAD